MTKAVVLLAEEHELLSRILDWFEVLLNRAKHRDELDGAQVCSLLSFFEVFVDGQHQDKEEQVLFPVLLGHASGSTRTRLERLVSDHNDERRRLEAMRSNLEGAAYGDHYSLDGFLVNADRYLALQRRHLAYENRWLLPLAEELLTEADDERLCAHLRDLEQRQGTRFSEAAQYELGLLDRDRHRFAV